MGICGTGMGSLAGMFHERGFRVTGSDQGVYPPMSDFLAELGIHVMEGYCAANLDPRPDLVVVGNVIRRTNPEAIELEKLGIPFTSMPGALNRFFVAGKTRIVTTGTHGKTTVSAMIASILHEAGLDPGFMIGGLPSNFGRNYRLGNGDYFVLEGDEYDTAYFDKRPKFIHYRPSIGVITSCEFDHADIYADLEQIKSQFTEFAGLIPADGRLVVCWEDPEVREVVNGSGRVLERYGWDFPQGWSLADVRPEGLGTAARFLKDSEEKASGTVPVMGRHNLLNALAALAVAAEVGIEPQRAVNALESFRGVRRRQEILGTVGGVTVIDDFAHHPTAVRETCAAVRTHHQGRRLVAVFEPATNTSRRSIFQSDYAPAFEAADVVVAREPHRVERIPPGDRFRAGALAQDLRARGKDAHAFETTDEVVEFLRRVLQSGDVVLVMSNGSFDDLNARLMRALRERSG
jgi:UDP-N-acetylmuramate: L-alanyl-gamma-D-glutamyl-meso-diaminopimelate ligase